jgi:hypothetical protein
MSLRKSLEARNSVKTVESDAIPFIAKQAGLTMRENSTETVVFLEGYEKPAPNRAKPGIIFQLPDEMRSLKLI